MPATNPELYRLLYSNFYRPKSPRFAYASKEQTGSTDSKGFICSCPEPTGVIHTKDRQECCDRCGLKCKCGPSQCYPNPKCQKCTNQNSGGGSGGGTDFGELFKNPMVILGVGGGFLLIILLIAMR